jgi:hypothetical protein
MVLQGVIHNGVVVFPGPVQWPEGTPVRVEAVSEQSDEVCGDRAVADDPLWRMAELAGPTGISDLATNLDHYLYGHPKVEDEP